MLMIKKNILGWLTITSFFVLSACFGLPVEEPVLPPPVVQTFVPDQHEVVTLERGTLQRYRNLNVNVIPATEEVLMFLVPDVYIQAIHVEVGDEVSAGDVVAELNRDAFVRAIYNARREIEATQINIGHLAERQPLNVLEADILGVEPYLYQDEQRTLQVEMAIHQLTVDYLQAEDERRILRSPISGTVTHTMPFREGYMSDLGTRVVTVADETRSIFSVSAIEARYLSPGDVHIVSVNREPMEAIVINPDDLGLTAGENQAFLMAYGHEFLYFPSWAHATLNLVLEELENVISIPFDAIHEVNNRIFVYVMEDGIRVLRDVELGLEGNHAVEVLRGLYEGEILVVG